MRSTPSPVLSEYVVVAIAVPFGFPANLFNGKNVAPPSVVRSAIQCVVLAGGFAGRVTVTVLPAAAKDRDAEGKPMLAAMESYQRTRYMTGPMTTPAPADTAVGAAAGAARPSASTILVRRLTIWFGSWPLQMSTRSPSCAKLSRCDPVRVVSKDMGAIAIIRPLPLRGSSGNVSALRETFRRYQGP